MHSTPSPLSVQNELMATLQEDELWDSISDRSSATPYMPGAALRACGLADPQSPAFSIDSLQSNRQRSLPAVQQHAACMLPPAELSHHLWASSDPQSSAHYPSLLGHAQGQPLASPPLSPVPAMQYEGWAPSTHKQGEAPSMPAQHPLVRGGSGDSGGGAFAPLDMKTSPQKLETASFSPTDPGPGGHMWCSATTHPTL